MNLHARLGRLERAQPIAPDRTHSNAALNWLLSETATTHPELNARVLALADAQDRTALASAVCDLADAGRHTDEFFNRCRRDRTG